MDINVQTHLKQSEINGLYQEIEDLKTQRARLKETIDTKTEKIIKHILKHGNVIAYKENVSYILTVKLARTTKFDKSALSNDLNVPQKELDLVGVAELVEGNRITSQKLSGYYYEDQAQKLNARKAKKSDIELIFGGRS
ncbi:hypothetical protein [Halolactibacillus sp. JCM 19043]|uniref:hypothetical protein n=1 Tax=Halolactibacillus sp. JCM 19043 TaxID=1460638 RepID=UPI000782059D|nr:hypothetical protein [Halolactibacillus sp. JCM 19043]